MAATMGKFHLFPNGTIRKGLSYFVELIKHQEVKEIRWARGSFPARKLKQHREFLNRLPRVFFLFHYISAVGCRSLCSVAFKHVVFLLERCRSIVLSTLSLLKGEPGSLMLPIFSGFSLLDCGSNHATKRV